MIGFVCILYEKGSIHMATVIIALLVVLVLFLAARQLYKDKKKGRSLCGGKCSCCPNGCACAKTESDSVHRNYLSFLTD